MPVKTKRTELARIWSQFVKIMKDKCQQSTGLDALLNKDMTEVASWIIAMHTGDNVADASKVAAYIALMYTLETSVQEEIERILLSLLVLCLDS